MKQGLTCTFILFYRTTDNEITLSHTEQAFQKDPCESFTLHRGLSVRGEDMKRILGSRRYLLSFLN